MALADLYDSNESKCGFDLDIYKVLRETSFTDDFIRSIGRKMAKNNTWLQFSAWICCVLRSGEHPRSVTSHLSIKIFTVMKSLISKENLEMLGVVIGFNQNYKLVVDNLKSPADNIGARR
ncbi:hypothetical protein LOK49_LG04G02320 [Camellia lanceoleosa]|uniref:Uncharacterized protein n=1 Tax=Camellia lanceoleosa TaxID=1840588 RepID=A0ACC0HXB3_9ERIC|nr:hypothetical protein LOK49_LG04G02320 [Camellia lanceoleosa]